MSVLCHHICTPPLDLLHAIAELAQVVEDSSRTMPPGASVPAAERDDDSSDKEAGDDSSTGLQARPQVDTDVDNTPGRIRRDALDDIFRRWQDLKKNET